jgi:hypothetical protein
MDDSKLPAGVDPEVTGCPAGARADCGLSRAGGSGAVWACTLRPAIEVQIKIHNRCRRAGLLRMILPNPGDRDDYRSNKSRVPVDFTGSWEAEGDSG